MQPRYLWLTTATLRFILILLELECYLFLKLIFKIERNKITKFSEIKLQVNQNIISTLTANLG